MHDSDTSLKDLSFLVDFGPMFLVKFQRRLADDPRRRGVCVIDVFRYVCLYLVPR